MLSFTERTRKQLHELIHEVYTRLFTREYDRYIIRRGRRLQDENFGREFYVVILNDS